MICWTSDYYPSITEAEYDVKNRIKKLLVKILAENIHMELPITLKEFFSHTINSFFTYGEYAAAIVAIDHFKREEVVGYVPLFLSKTLNKFLCFPGSYVSCKITGTRK